MTESVVSPARCFGAQFFEQRLAKEVERLKTEAKKQPLGKEREDMMRKARQAETASQISAWLFSPDLQKPT